MDESPNNGETPIVFKGIKDVFLEWMGNTSIHGIPKIIKSNHFVLRTLWLICTLIALGLLFYTTISAIFDYFAFNTNTNIKILKEMPTNFPAVSICNYNIYNKNDSVQEVLSYYLEQNLEKIFERKSDFKSLKYAFTSTQRYLEAYIAKLSDEEKTDFSLALDEMLMSCQFQKTECSKDDFEHFWNSKFGNCYRFNSGKNASNHSVPIRKSFSQGYVTGLKLELYLGEQYENNWFVEGNGVYVVVHNQSLIPIIPEEGIYLPVGKSNYVAINRKFYKTLGNPFSDCLEDTNSPNAFNSDLFRLTLNVFKQYSQKYCYKFCLQSLIIKKCGCHNVLFSSYNINNAPACSNISQIDCLDDSEQLFNSNNYININCRPSCPLECDQVKYDLSVFGTDYPSAGYGILVGAIHQFGTATKRNILELNIYYDSSEYEYIFEVEAVTSLQLISSIGGYLGLFLGISVLSVLEVFEMMTLIFLKFFKTANKKQPKPAFK